MLAMPTRGVGAGPGVSVGGSMCGTGVRGLASAGARRVATRSSSACFPGGSRDGRYSCETAPPTTDRLSNTAPATTAPRRIRCMVSSLQYYRWYRMSVDQATPRAVRGSMLSRAHSSIQAWPGEFFRSEGQGLGGYSAAFCSQAPSCDIEPTKPIAPSLLTAAYRLIPNGLT